MSFTQTNSSTLTLLFVAFVVLLATLEFTGAECITDKEPPSYECAHSDHKFAHPTDSHRYRTCQCNIYHIYNCPPGKKFDKASEECV
ncbi:MAG: hypothetical protein BYD32DRAFT_419253 [Podila humilis]|nr:MAG: hypothetical protein BYD32DRAFT_419253 [Podila humilis]